MEINIFFKLTKDLIEKINASNLLTTLNKFNQDLVKANQAVTQQPAQQQNQIRQTQLSNIAATAKTEILNQIDSILPYNITPEESAIFDSIGATELFGTMGKERIEKIFSENNTNANALRQSLTVYQQQVQKVVNFYSSYSTTFEKLITYEETDASLNAIKLFFQGEVEINTLDELPSVATKWNQNIIAFAVLVKENDRTIKIESVHRGSIVLTLSVIAAIAVGFGKATNLILDAVKKVYEIKKIAADLKQLNAKGTEKPIHDLEQNSKLKVKSVATEIAAELLTEYGWDGEENTGAVRNGIEIALRHMLKFINKGGRIDIRLSQDTDEIKQLKLSISTKYKELNEIEQKITVITGRKESLELSEHIEEDEAQDTATGNSPESNSREQ